MTPREIGDYDTKLMQDAHTGEVSSRFMQWDPILSLKTKG
jgi:hypothetical protein